MLEISKTSWHYRLWKFGRENTSSRPKNLCQYFWHLFLIKMVVPMAICGLALFGLGALAWVIIQNPVQAAQIIATIVLVVGALTGLIVWAHRSELKTKAEEEARLKRIALGEEEPAPPKDPNIFVEWLRATKAKACPLIKVRD